MKNITLFFYFLIFLGTTSANAYTEIGLSYSRKTTTFDTSNSFDAESITASASLYFLERMAVELSYTDGTGLRKEKASSGDPLRTTVQKSQVLGADLILMLASRKALFQPYLKVGTAQINRYQEVKIEGQNTYRLEPESAVVPSYGGGLKVQLTETFALKFSYDVWKTPIGSGMSTDDSAMRAGVTWIL